MIRVNKLERCGFVKREEQATITKLYNVLEAQLLRRTTGGSSSYAVDA